VACKKGEIYLKALLKCQASKFDQPDYGDRHNVITNNNLPLVTNADGELNDGGKKENFVNYPTVVHKMQIPFC
jgi:hypothetical protein